MPAVYRRLRKLQKGRCAGALRLIEKHRFSSLSQFLKPVDFLAALVNVIHVFSACLPGISHSINRAPMPSAVFRLSWAPVNTEPSLVMP
jgi:hypothetical protein